MRFLRDDSGATAIEYSLIAASIFLVIATSIGAIGPPLKAIFESIVPHLQ